MGLSYVMHQHNFEKAKTMLSAQRVIGQSHLVKTITMGYQKRFIYEIATTSAAADARADWQHAGIGSHHERHPARLDQGLEATRGRVRGNTGSALAKRCSVGSSR
jgi:hypothetical protein